MTIEVTTKVFGQGKRHHIAFTLGGAQTMEQLLPLPSRAGSHYSVTGGLVAGISGSFYIAGAKAVLSIASASVANPTVITTAAPHLQTGTFTVTLKGVDAATPTVNGKFTATVTGASTFTIPVNVTVGPTAATGDGAVEPVSMSSVFEVGAGIAFLAVAGVTGQAIEPMELPQDKALVLSCDSEGTILTGYLLVEESFAKA